MAPRFSSPIEAILAVDVALIFLGGLLVRRGVWPRRKGDEPHCRQCDYSLVDLQTDRRPECGSVLSPVAITRGQRHRRPRFIWTGAIVILLGLATMIPLASPRVRNLPWYHYKPTFMVMRDLRSGSVLAIQELTRREQAGELSTSIEQQIDEIALAAQATTATDQLTSNLIEFLTGQYLAGHLTEAEKHRFEQQSFIVRLRAPAVVIAGEKTSYQVDESSRARSSGLMVLVEYGDPQIDGKEVPAQRGTTSPDDPYADGDEYGLTHFITTIFKGIGSTSHSGALVIKTVGKHQLQLTVRIEIGLDKANPAKVFYLEDHKLTADFDVVAKASSASTQASQAQ